MADHRTDSSHAPSGMTRFPPNIEPISVDREATSVWLVTRRNDVVLRFPLREEDCRHLAAMLLGRIQTHIGEDRQ
jgi:hypothetical protein